jgi:hypothetical protein
MSGELPIKDVEQGVRQFLLEFKSLLEHGQYHFKNHYKNAQCLIDLDLTLKDVEKVLFGLTIENYAAGPITDEMHPGVLWVFGDEITGVELYIKLKIVELPANDEQAVCISFHPAEYPQRYPLRRGQRKS